mgnify:CR=1 FL=1
MEKQNQKYLWSLIKATGDFLVGKLPEHPYHPDGRNPYAHVASRIKKHFHQSYKDLPDDKMEEIIEYLKIIKKEEGWFYSKNVFIWQVIFCIWPWLN